MPTEYWQAVLDKAKADKVARAQWRRPRRKKKKKRRGFVKTLEIWTKSVKARDDYTCQDCGKRQRCGLHAHHIKAKADRPELKLYVKNGVTLCRDCHNIRHDGLLDYYSDQVWLKSIVSQGEPPV